MASIRQWLSNFSVVRDARALTAALAPIAASHSTRNIVSPALAIKTGGSALVKSGAASYAMVGGVLVNTATATDMAALSGTVTNAKFNVFCFYVDAAGTLTTVMGAEAATLAGVKLPPQSATKALIGFVVINPTGTGNFVGGTTALDDATVVPNAAYVNVTGGLDPAVTP